MASRSPLGALPLQHLVTAAPLRSNPGAKFNLLPNFVSITLAIFFLYSAFGNIVPANIRPIFMIFAFGPSCAAAIFECMFHPHDKTRGMFLAILVLTLPTSFAVILLEPHNIVDAFSFGKFLFTMLTFFFFWYNRKRLPPQLLSWLSLALLVFIVYWAATKPVYYWSTDFKKIPYIEGRFAPFQDGPQVSGYVALGAMMIVHQLYLAKQLKKFIAYTAIAGFMVMIYGYRESQVIFSSVVYIGSYYLFLDRPMKAIPGIRLAGFFLVGALVLTAVVMEHELRNLSFLSNGTGRLDVSQLGSGRIGVWVERLRLIGQSDLLELIFGRGAGSDLMYSYIWNAIDPSHNTFLSVMIEYGLIGLISFCLWFFFTLSAVGPVGYPFVLAIAASCIVGNGIPLRGAPCVLTFIAMALAAGRAQSRTPRTTLIRSASHSKFPTPSNHSVLRIQNVMPSTGME